MADKQGTQGKSNSRETLVPVRAVRAVSRRGAGFTEKTKINILTLIYILTAFSASLVNEVNGCEIMLLIKVLSFELNLEKLKTWRIL